MIYYTLTIQREGVWNEHFKCIQLACNAEMILCAICLPYFIYNAFPSLRMM